MSKYGYKFNEPPNCWEESERIGNGTLGALDYCEDNSKIKLVPTHENLFMPSFNDYEPIKMASHLSEIRKLINHGEYEKASEIPLKLRNEKTDEKLWTNAFMPLADIVIDVPEHNLGNNYERVLDIDNSIISYRNDDIKREEFISHNDNVGCIHLESEKSSKFNISLEKHIDPKNKLANLSPNTVAADLQAILNNETLHPVRGLEEPVITVKNGMISFYVKYEKRKSFYKVKDYIIHVKILNTDGDITCNESSITVQNSKKLDIVWTIIVNPNENERNNFNVDNSYDELKENHILKWREKNKDFKFELVEPNVHNKNLEQIFHASKYTILSSTGVFPPNLQGLWTAIFQVPWSGDWTIDGNLQTAIMALLQCGNFDEYKSVFNLVDEHLDEFKRNAKDMYGSDGIFLPSRVTDSGYCYHYQIDYPMAFLHGTAAWFARMYFEYYQYTQNKKELEQKIVPFMKLVAKFYQDFLIEDESGKYVFIPSYSPENTPENANNPAVINATMDISLAKELLFNLCFALKTLGEDYSIYDEMLKKMPEYKFNDNDGSLKEWATDFLVDNYDHRHFSHLYALFYEIPKEFLNNKKLLDGSKTAYQKKLKYMEKDKGEMAFGSIQLGRVAAKLGDSETVNNVLGDLIKYNYYNTYMSSHNKGPSVFNADISGGLPALVLESLVQSNPIYNDDYSIDHYEIKFLPALPEILKNGGEIKNLRLKGGFSIDFSWKDGKIVNYNIDSDNENNKYIVI